MSIEKYRIALTLMLTILGIGLTLGLAGDRGEGSPILRFYCDKARTVCAQRSPVDQAVSYSFTATVYFKKLGRRGKVTHVDTASSDLYFSGESLDSQKVVASSPSKFPHLEFSYPNVFNSDYHFSFFPNDTGGDYLAVGFDGDSANDPRPVGLAIIDRNEYYLHRLYLFYPERERYKRVSQIFHFVEREGYLFPDSIYETAAKAGIFSIDYYRLEAVISNIRVYR